ARSAREAAKARPRRSSGRLASSQPRTSLRNASSDSAKSKFTVIALLHHHAAVDVQRLAGDVARLVGGEKYGGPADVLRRLLALHRRDIAHSLVEHLPRRHPLEGGVRLGEMGGE